MKSKSIASSAAVERVMEHSLRRFFRGQNANNTMAFFARHDGAVMAVPVSTEASFAVMLPVHGHTSETDGGFVEVGFEE